MTCRFEMNKTQMLHKWLQEKADWVYLNEIPSQNFNLTRQSTHETLTRLCNSGRADFRILGLKQYRAKNDT